MFNPAAGNQANNMGNEVLFYRKAIASDSKKIYQDIYENLSYELLCIGRFWNSFLKLFKNFSESLQWFTNNSNTSWTFFLYQLASNLSKNVVFLCSKIGYCQVSHWSIFYIHKCSWLMIRTGNIFILKIGWSGNDVHCEYVTSLYLKLGFKCDN